MGLAGCFHSGKQAPRKAEPELSLIALDAQHRRLVAHYQPVSRGLYDYEVALREWDRGGSDTDLSAAARALRVTVSRALERVRRDPASGQTAIARDLLEQALRARLNALDALLASQRAVGPARLLPPAYVRDWNESLVAARKALATLQDIRDKARLIPLPEDSIS